MRANKLLHKSHVTLKATCSTSSVKWLLHQFPYNEARIFFSVLSNFTFSLSGGSARRKLKDSKIREMLRHKGEVLRCKKSTMRKS